MDKQTKESRDNQTTPRNSIILQYCNKIYTQKILTTC